MNQNYRKNYKTVW